MSAPINDNGWDDALRELARQTRSVRMNLLAVGGADEIQFNHLTDVPSETWVEEFAEIGGGRADINWRIACVRDPLVVMSEADYTVARRALGNDIYADFSAHYDMLDGCQTVLLNEKHRFFGLAALRSRSDGKTTENDRALFAAAAPAALAAIRMQYALEHQGMSLFKGALEAMGAVAFLCDARGRVGALTAGAERQAIAHRGLRLHKGLLSAPRPEDDRLFQQAFAAALSDMDAAMPTTRLWLKGPDGPMSGHLCEIFRLPRREWSFGFEPRLLVTLREPAELDGGHARLLGNILGLSSAEADIALLAAKGLSREEIAMHRGAAPGTVNAQLKSIFRKSDVRREAELVALINRLMR